MTEPRAQSTFQIRLGWGEAGLVRLADSRIVVIIDALGRADVADAIQGANDTEAQDLAARAAALPHGPLVFLASLRNATATAQAVYDEQLAHGGRAAIDLVLVGDSGAFAVEDYLAAGAIADALWGLGLDHSSPEVAVAAEGFRSLKRALKHLLSASEAGVALKAADRRDEVRAAAELDADDAAIRFTAAE